MRPRTIAAGLILAGLAAWSAAPGPGTAPIAPLSDVPEAVARDGVLSVTLEARETKTVFDGIPVDTIVYNGNFAGPVLRLWPGDTLRVHFRNRLAEPSNLHFHGMRSSPLANGDNAHLSIPGGQDFDYELKIPDHQPPGAYWYHAHQHGLAEHQVGRGLSGSLMIEGFADGIPGLTGVKERLFAFKSIDIEDSDNPVVNDEWHGLVQTVNGLTTIGETLRPGETALWHLTNHDANLTVHLSLAGHRFTVVGMDGAAIPHAAEAEILDITPASRLEVLVTAGPPGSYELVTHNVLTGQGTALSRDRVIGKLTVAGAPMAPRQAVLPSVADLSSAAVTGHRRFVYTASKDQEKYYINDQRFDANRVDTRVRLGDVEDWTIENHTDDMHSFHIHQLSFQVMSVNGKPEPFNGLLDTVRVPEHGQVTIRLPFTKPEIVGEFMYHCHVLKHEDRGMMQNIVVEDPKAKRHASLGLTGWLAAWMRPGRADLPICGAGHAG